MTNAVIETLMTRRSVRAFQEKAIPADQLQAILETARFAPSGMGRQTWKFTAVTNREKIQKLAAAISKELGREGYNMYQPEVLIIPSNDVESPFGKEDNACALENIFHRSLVLRYRFRLDQPAPGHLRPPGHPRDPGFLRNSEKSCRLWHGSPGLSGTGAKEECGEDRGSGNC